MISPVPSLIRSNRTPTDTEAVLIRNSLKVVDEEIHVVRTLRGDPNILTSDSDLDAERNARKYLIYLENFRQQHTQLLSCIRRIPPELLSLILSFVVTPEYYDPQNHKPPWVLGHISQYWRQVALSTAVLWKYLPPIRITRQPQRPSVLKIIAALTTLLDRSSGKTISLFIDFSKLHPVASPILDIVFSHSERWEALSVRMTRTMKPRFDTIRGRLSSLQSLTLIVKTTGPLDMFEIAPKLKEVRVDDGLPFNALLVLPWEQLTKYEEEGSTLHSLANALRSSPCLLKSIRFTAHRFSDWTFQGGETILSLALPHLETLTFESFHDDGPQSVLDELTIPALKHLTIRTFGDPNFGSKAVPLIMRSSCPLQSLTFHTTLAVGNIGSGSIHVMFTIAPTLTSLCINDPTVDTLNLLFSTTTDRAAWLVLPTLKSLNIYVSKEWGHWHHKNLFQLAQGRCDLVFPIDHHQMSRKEDCKLPALQDFRLSSITVDSPKFHLLNAVGVQDQSGITDILELHAKIAEEEFQNQTLVGSMGTPAQLKTVNKQTIKRQRAFMEEMENLVVTNKNVGSLYISGIDYIFLSILGKLPDEEEKSVLRTRLRILTEKWTHILDAAMQATAWKWDCDGSLVYIAVGDRINGLPLRFRSEEFPATSETPLSVARFCWPVLSQE